MKEINIKTENFYEKKKSKYNPSDVKRYMTKLGLPGLVAQTKSHIKGTDETDVAKPRSNKFKIGSGGKTSNQKLWQDSSAPTQNSYRRSTLVKPGGTNWFELLPSNDVLTSSVEVSKDLIHELRAEAKQLLEADIQAYKQGQSRGDFAWIERVLHGGTLADKMAAHTTLLQDSAVHNLSSLDALMTLVSTKVKRECLMATDTLKDLFVNNLLPEDRKLTRFEMRPLSKLDELSSGNKESRHRRLLLWYFEDILRVRYIDFLQALEKVTHDTVVKTKQKAVSAIGELLSSNPEQEQLLLTMLVNKLGDPVQQVAGKVIHALASLLQEHPKMKCVIAQEIEQFLYRPHLREKAQYYSLCCLNQIVLDQEDSDLALRLIQIYLGFFRSCLKKEKKKIINSKGLVEVDFRLMSAILTGLSRAAPYNKKNSSVLTEHLDSLYALLHKVPFNIRTQALTLLYQVHETGSERFYSALYRYLLDPGLQVSTRQAVFLNLLYRCLKRDQALLRVLAFTKRILQVCHHLSPPISCGLLVLLSQVFKQRPEAFSVFRTPGLPLTMENSSHFIDDVDEYFEDAPEEEDTFTSDPDSQSPFPEDPSSWVHLKNKQHKRENSEGYDPKHRNPLYSMGGENTLCWELCSLTKHFHPSVALFARNLASQSGSNYCGDPLQDFTLSRFLERFVYRNPKQLASNQGTDEPAAIVQPRKTAVFGKRKLYIPAGLRKVSVQSQEYLQNRGENVPEEEKYLYEYRVLENRKRKLEDEDDDAQSVTSEDFQAMLDRTEPGTMDKMDFSNAIKGDKKTSKEQEDEDYLTDDEEGFDDDDEFQEAFQEYNEDLQGFEGEDFDKMVGEMDQAPKRSKFKNHKDGNLGQLFASAEQFSGLLEDQADDRVPSITATAMANKDRANSKQLAWELKRQPQQWQEKKRHKRKSQ